MTIAIVIGNRPDYEAAARLKKGLGQATLFAPKALGLKNAVGYDKITDCLASLFGGRQQIIAFAATGVVIRSLAGQLADKRNEPPVLAVVGGCVIPLLGAAAGDGHRLGQEVAGILKLTAITTTASASRFAVELENPPDGWRLLNLDAFKKFAADLLNHGEADLTAAPSWLKRSRLRHRKTAALKIIQTINPLPPDLKNTLAYAPQRLALGVGCIRHCPKQQLYDFALKCLAKYDLAPEAVGGVFTTAIKADEEAIHYLAEKLAVPMRLFAPSTLRRQAVGEESAAVLRAVGSPSVSEAAALAAIEATLKDGGGGELLIPKQIGEVATVAVAAAPEPLDVGEGSGEGSDKGIGKPPGLLQVIGLGAGGGGDLTFKAAAALASCEAVVGYRRYVEMASAFIGRATVHKFNLGEEEKRVRHALELAQEGRVVGLVCSGDPGIYAMACLVFEMMATAGMRIRTKVLGGVTAMSEAAAASGAILGHDFCAVSLSDLLTDEATILKRLEAAAKADLVLALYNPTSARRAGLYRKAVRLLSEHLAATTPVVAATNLCRPGEAVRVATLAQLPRLSVDMNTIILVGNSSSKITDGKAYTPRGYGLRRPAQSPPKSPPPKSPPTKSARVINE